MANYNKFKGRLPYASEMSGVYQPLLGWRSKMTLQRMVRGESTIFRNFTERALLRAHVELEIEPTEGPVVVRNLEVPDVNRSLLVPRVATEIECVIALEIKKQLPKDRPSASKWRALLDRDDVLTPALSAAKNTIEVYVRALGDVYGASMAPDVMAYLGNAIKPFLATSGGGVSHATMVKTILEREVAVSGYLLWLAHNRTEVLDTLFYREQKSPFEDILAYQDPLATFGRGDAEAVLSPVGLVHLFRQYFFDLDTFLGPAVGHIWMSPGATLELVEQTTTRVLTERSFELTGEQTEKSETSETLHDEIADAIREESRSDTKLGFGASANYHNGTVDVGAHSDLSLDRSRGTSREATHKRLRDQSQKLSSEIRRGFKSTFKTTTERTDSSTRRYVLQNKTDALINYELRRKMRHVGVQVQDIGTRLCWQVFVDDPGRELGVAELLHIAQSPDLSGLHEPPTPVSLEPKVVEVSLQFPFMLDPNSQGSGERDVDYIEGDDQEAQGKYGHYGDNDRIIPFLEYPLVPPAPGYTLASGPFPARSEHPGTVEPEVQRVSDDRVRVHMHRVNFADQDNVELLVTTVWNPDPKRQEALQRAYDEELKTFKTAISVKEREEFLKAVKERVNLASKIKKRPFEDLREEERIAVYRRLMGQLMSVGEQQNQDIHVTAELVRTIFEVDNMLYFVAPEWWRSRERAESSRLKLAPSARFSVGASEIVGWDGPKAAGRKDNYLITEESDPAELGSSLGWLLQLDGDRLRNAFLNSPWVKAVMPIRPGKEAAALNWLELSDKAGSQGLDSEYQAPEAELARVKKGIEALGHTPSSPLTIRDALSFLAHEIEKGYKVATTAQPSPFDPNRNVVPTDVVFEHGFDPLEEGFEVNTDPNRVFCQWTEVLPTDQVVAVEYDPAKHK